MASPVRKPIKPCRRQPPAELHHPVDRLGGRRWPRKQHCRHAAPPAGCPAHVSCSTPAARVEDQRKKDQVAEPTLASRTRRSQRNGAMTTKKFGNSVRVKFKIAHEQPGPICATAAIVSGLERKRRGGNRRAGAPGDDGRGLVAREMVHLADRRDRSAEGRRRDHQRLADRRMVAHLQHRAADIARENDGKQRADPHSRGIASQLAATKSRIAAPNRSAAIMANIDPKLSDLRSLRRLAHDRIGRLPSIRPAATHRPHRPSLVTNSSPFRLSPV